MKYISYKNKNDLFQNMFCIWNFYRLSKKAKHKLTLNKCYDVLEVKTTNNKISVKVVADSGVSRWFPITIFRRDQEVKSNYWVISIGGYGDFFFKGNRKKAEEMRSHKARWEGGIGWKRVAYKEEIAAEKTIFPVEFHETIIN